MTIAFQDRSETQHFGLLLGFGAVALMLCDRNYAPPPNLVYYNKGKINPIG
jgi:hypothetical protein